MGLRVEERAPVAVTPLAGRRTLALLVVGPVLYAALTWVTNIYLLSTGSHLQVRPAVVVPLFMGFAFGPLVGFVTGCLGNMLGDFTAGYLTTVPPQSTGFGPLDLFIGLNMHWQIGNGLFGLITGLAAWRYRRYRSVIDYLRAVAIALVAITVGLAFGALFKGLVITPSLGLAGAYEQRFLPLARVDWLNTIVILPIVLFNYAHFDDLREINWMQSGLMRRLATTILVSSLWPIIVLGFLLSEQTTGTASKGWALWIKLGLTLLLTLGFTVLNASLVTKTLSAPLLRLIDAAHQMVHGDLTSDEAHALKMVQSKDEISELTQVFGRMAEEVTKREQALHQQVAQLKIEIDETKKALEVAQVTDSDYFRDLQARAARIRGTSTSTVKT